MNTPVDIEITKGVDKVSSYRGLISSEDLSSILAGKMRKPFVKLEAVYWTNEVWSEKKKCMEHRIVRLGITPPYEHHHGTIWIRPEHIAVILPLETLAVIKPDHTDKLSSRKRRSRR